ncbi:MAG TPA: hypothetical protein VHM88_06575 [Candidatus Acidoferrales bacterium]|nr:hypothetical protein [Candidatus Acidoferrales bacterium]
MDLELEVVDRDPVFQVAVETVGLFDQQGMARAVPAQELEHLAEVGSSGLLGGFDVHELP